MKNIKQNRRAEGALLIVGVVGVLVISVLLGAVLEIVFVFLVPGPFLLALFLVLTPFAVLVLVVLLLFQTHSLAPPALIEILVILEVPATFLATPVPPALLDILILLIVLSFLAPFPPVPLVLGILEVPSTPAPPVLTLLKE